MIARRIGGSIAGKALVDHHLGDDHLIDGSNRVLWHGDAERIGYG
jgi:hypothetical protein